MGNVTQLHPRVDGEEPVFSREEACTAARNFRRTQQVVLRVLADVTDEHGVVEMTIEEVGLRSGYGRDACLRAARALVASGIVGRDQTPGGRVGILFKWDLELVQKTAAQVREKEAQRQATRRHWNVNFDDAAAWKMWLHGYAVARAASAQYRTSVPLIARPDEPKPQHRAELVQWGARMAFAYGRELSTIIQYTLSAFFGSKNVRLREAGHPLTWLRFELAALEPAIASMLRREHEPTRPAAKSHRDERDRRREVSDEAAAARAEALATICGFASAGGAR